MADSLKFDTGLFCVFMNGEWAMAEQHRGDADPERAGIYLLNRLKKEKNLDNYDELRARMKALTVVDASDRARRVLRKDTQVIGNKVGFGLAGKSETWQHPLDKIMDQDIGQEVETGIEIAKHGFFCDYCYVVDLDKESFEVYTGRPWEEILATHKWENERFHRPEIDYSINKTCPVMKIAEWKLDELPNLKQFLVACNVDNSAVLEKEVLEKATLEYFRTPSKHNY